MVQRLGAVQELTGPSCLQRGRAVDKAGMFTALERRAEDDNATLLFTGLVGGLEQVRMAGTCKAMHVPRWKLRLSRNGSPAFAMRQLCVLAAVEATAGLFSACARAMTCLCL